MTKLILIRHGESIDNAKNIFTGWLDTALSKTGEDQAKTLDLKKFEIKQVFSSPLQRCKKTTEIVLKNLKKDLLVHYHWQLLVRHYGSLQGENKDNMRTIYGKELVAKWRRGYSEIPPKESEKKHQELVKFCLENFENIIESQVPYTESNKQSYQRVISFFEKTIRPNLNQNTLIVGHGSTIRALMMHLKNLSEEETSKLEIEPTTPIIIEFDHVK